MHTSQYTCMTIYTGSIKRNPLFAIEVAAAANRVRQPCAAHAMSDVGAVYQERESNITVLACRLFVSVSGAFTGGLGRRGLPLLF